MNKVLLEFIVTTPTVLRSLTANYDRNLPKCTVMKETITIK